MKSLLIFLSFGLVLFLNQSANAQAINKAPVIDAWITQVDPQNLNSLRINIQNSNDPDGKVVKTEINANGTVFTNQNDVYYTEPMTNRWSYSFKGAVPKLFQLKGQIPIQIKIWDNKNLMTEKIIYVDANNQIKLQDNLINRPFNATNLISAKKYNFNVSSANIEKKYTVTLNRIKKTNAVQNFLAQLLNLFGLNTPLNTFSAQVKINGVDIFKAGEVSQSTNQIVKFVSLKAANSVAVTYTNAQYNQVDLDIHEVLFIKEANLPIITSNVQSNSFTNEPILIFNIQDESTVYWEAVVNDTIYNQAIEKYGGFQLDSIVNVNTMSVTARDIFGNISNFSLQNITLDVAPPQIISKNPVSGAKKYTNQLPYNAPVVLQFNEVVSSVKIGGIDAQLGSDGKTASLQIQNETAGLKNMAVIAKDLAGNVTSDNISYEVIFVNTPPVISIQNSDYILQNSKSINLNFNIESSISTATTVKLNGVEILVSDLKTFVNAAVNNLLEGVNLIEISSVDAAGNISLVKNISVQVDSILPQLANSSVADNLQIYTNTLPYTLPFRFEFSESVTSVIVASGSGLLVGPNVFQGQIAINSNGTFPIRIFATDIAGNVADITKNINISFSDKLPNLTFNPIIDNILTSQPRIDVAGFSDQFLKTISVNGNPIAIGMDGKSFAGIYDAVQDGVYQLEVVATDIFGNVRTTVQRVRVIASLPPELKDYLPRLAKTPTGYRVDYGPLFNGPDKDAICGALDQIFAAIPEAHSALDQIDRVKADIDKYKEYVPDIVNRNVPDTQGVKDFLGDVEEPLNRIKGAYLSVCKNVDILPALDCPGDRLLFKMIMGEFPEPLIIRQMVFIPLPVQEVLIPRTNICTGFDDSGLTCDEMIKLTPLIGQILSPAMSEVMSSPIAQGVMNILLCEDICAAPVVKEQPLLCKDVNIPGFPRVKKMPTRFDLGGSGGGISMDWGGSSGCGGFFNSCGGSGGGSGGESCGWFDSCGGAGSDGSINGRDFACSVFSSLWFCQSSDPLAATPPTPTTTVNIQPVPVCDPEIKLSDLINANPTNSTMIISRYLATCMPSAVPFLPDIKKPIITVTAPAQNTLVATATVRVTGYVDDVSSKVKIEGVFVTTIVGSNGIYFDTTISVPTDGIINVEAADAAGNLADPVIVQLQKSTDLNYSTGEDQTCYIKNKEVFCWGYNDKLVPTIISTGLLYKKISVGASLGCGITINDEINCFKSYSILDPGVKYKEISVGSSHQCAITINGELKCWGANFYGEIGDGTHIDRYVPVLIDAGVTYRQISAGGSFTCGITTENILKCWGINSYGQLGTGNYNDYNVPVIIGNVSNGATIYAKGRDTCLYEEDRTVKCWGNNQFGQLGIGDFTDRKIPTLVDGGTKFKSFSKGRLHNCGITDSNVLKCWGWNLFGQLGVGDYVNSSISKTVDAGVQYVSVFPGAFHTCAKTIDNKIKCWGSNSLGQFGNGTTISSPVPVDINQ